MQPAQDRLNRALTDAGLSDPQVPLVGNVTAGVLNSADAIRQDLQAQLTSRVRWTESIQAMRSAGITTFIELGAGNVLCGLVRRIDRSAATFAVDSVESLTPLAT